MRLKSYNAATMAEAMRMVREELGDDAIIVSTQRASDGQGVRITAALEDPSDDDDIDRALTGRNVTISKMRGEVMPLREGLDGFITVHPSFLLRLPDEAAKAKAYEMFVQDLKFAWSLAG